MSPRFPRFDRCASACSRFVYRLFFTRNDDLDLLQVAYLSMLALADYAWWRNAIALEWKVTSVMWTFMAGQLGILVLAAVPKWVGDLIVRNRTAGEVAQAVATARDPRLPGPDDDERNDAPLD